MPNSRYLNYSDKVIAYLEYIGYPDYVLEFNEWQVANAINKTITLFYVAGASYRECALNIFGITWETQILPTIKGAVKH